MHTGSVVFQPTPGASSCTVSLAKPGQNATISTVDVLSYPQTTFYPVNLLPDTDYTVELKCKLPGGNVLNAPLTKILHTPVNNSHPAVINFAPTSNTSGNLTVVPPDPAECKPKLYEVNVATNSGAKLPTINSTSTVIAITGLSPGVTYSIVVDAICQDGSTTKSSESVYLTPPPKQSVNPYVVCINSIFFIYIAYYALYMYML